MPRQPNISQQCEANDPLICAAVSANWADDGHQKLQAIGRSQTELCPINFHIKVFICIWKVFR